VGVPKWSAPDCPPALVELAIACCREDPDARPSLAQVVECLDKLNKVLCNSCDLGCFSKQALFYVQELKLLTMELDNQTLNREGRDLFLGLCTGVRPSSSFHAYNSLASLKRLFA